jgi:hypothetical protein
VHDSGFAKIDSLFIKDFYVSVRPEGLRRARSTATLRPDTTLVRYDSATAHAAADSARAQAARDSARTAAPAPTRDTATADSGAAGT